MVSEEAGEAVGEFTKEEKKSKDPGGKKYLYLFRAW